MLSIQHLSLSCLSDSQQQQSRSQLMESDLYCPLCSNQYSSDNMPRLLTACGHTYCHSCLDTLIIEDDHQFRLQCPEDDIVVFLRSNDISQFPKNIALIKLIEGKKHSSPKDESLQITNIQKHEDSHGNESQQEIINEIVSSGKLSDKQEETLRKDNSTHSQDPQPPAQVKPKPAAKPEEELCLVHQKPLQIVCMVDMEKICAKCAIFGNHKGHELKSIEQIEQQCNLLHEDILNVYNGQQDIVKQWNAINSKEVLEILEVNRKKIIKEVSDRYKRLRDAVARSEEAMLAKIDETCGILQEKIRATLKIDEGMMKQYSKFQNESFGIIIKFQESGLYEQKLRMLYDNATTSLLFKGKDIVARIRAQHNNIFNQIEKIINSIKMEYNEDEVFQALNHFSKIRIEQSLQEKHDAKAAEKHQEESLLESEMEEQNDEQHYHNMAATTNVFLNPQVPPSLPAQTFSVTFPEPKNIPKIEQRLEVKPEQSLKLREPLVAFQEQQVEKIERPPKKKLKSIKVPEKIEKILQSLYNDTLDTLDLTNAELGDSIVLQICDFLRGTRVRTVKFIRNKLSDDAVGKMISSFSGVSTLNLSQNFLTEQTLTHLANQRNSMPNLKTVILSQNKIIERKHKEFIERLKRMDLNVST